MMGKYHKGARQKAGRFFFV